MLTAPAENKKACFFVNGHPEFKGSGTVNITGNTKHAYASDEYTRLKHSAGTFNILSAAGGDGMHIKQYLQMEGGNIIVRNVADDGIQVEITNDETDEMNGQMIIQNGKMDIEVNSPDVKALRSDSLMTINGGTIKLEVTGDGSKGMTTDTDIYVDETVAPVNVNIHCTGGEYFPPERPRRLKEVPRNQRNGQPHHHGRHVRHLVYGQERQVDKSGRHIQESAKERIFNL